MKSNLYFLIQKKLLIFNGEIFMSAELKGCVTWFIYFSDLIKVRYNCAKFHYCRVCVTWEAPERSILKDLSVKESLKFENFQTK